ncbi:MAG: tripartite ATP-independent periplasmic transporter, DctQ component family protein [candidate division NC10 bacterium]|nr:tripartite ATP-independent periplasmic transporter, DctQ component family protein [candidate division NC10 bacterium]
MLSSLDRVVQRTGRVAVILAMMGILGLLALGVVVRVFPVIPLAGYDEVVELLMAWMTFLGAAILWGEGSLYRVDVLTSQLSPRAGRVVRMGVLLVSLVFAVVLTLEGWRVAVLSAETTPFLRFPKSIAYASMPVAGAIMMGYTLVGIGRALLGLRRC